MGNDQAQELTPMRMVGLPPLARSIDVPELSARLLEDGVSKELHALL